MTGLLGMTELDGAFRAAKEMSRLYDAAWLKEMAITKEAARVAGMLRMQDIAMTKAMVKVGETLRMKELEAAREMTQMFEAFRLAEAAKAQEMARVVESASLKALDGYKIGIDKSLFGQLENLRLGIDLPSWKLLDIQPIGIEAIQSTLAKMESQWIASQDSIRSIAAASELCGLSKGIIDLKPYGGVLSEVMRMDFGDWRKVTAFPKAILDNPSSRSGFYRGLGFNDDLTDFPAPAFNELLNRSGLESTAWPEPATDYAENLGIAPNVQGEDVPEGNRKAYNIIYRLESKFRSFIDSKMKENSGNDWYKHRLPKEMYAAWKEKQARAEANGQPESPLIAYADFSDYQQIIERKDNWTEVFGPFFRRKTDIQESLIRLAPVRICAMHCRIITNDDLLLLCAEASRIFKIIGSTVN